MFDERHHVWPYRATGHYDDPTGYVVWRLGTGGNIELLHLRAYSPRQGHGRELLRRMLKLLRVHPPYHSVFGFCLPGNGDGQAFYRAVGFDVHRVPGVYAAGAACLFTQEYRTLCKLNGVLPGGLL